jgi:hypothetical protein
MRRPSAASSGAAVRANAATNGVILVNVLTMSSSSLARRPLYQRLPGAGL